MITLTDASCGYTVPHDDGNLLRLRIPIKTATNSDINPARFWAPGSGHYETFKYFGIWRLRLRKLSLKAWT